MTVSAVFSRVRFGKDLLERNVFTPDKEFSKLYERMSRRQVQRPRNAVQYPETRKAPRQPAPLRLTPAPCCHSEAAGVTEALNARIQCRAA